MSIFNRGLIFTNTVSPLLSKLPLSNAHHYLFENGLKSEDVSALYIDALKSRSPIADDLKKLYTREPELYSAEGCRRIVTRILRGLSESEQAQPRYGSEGDLPSAFTAPFFTRLRPAPSAAGTAPARAGVQDQMAAEKAAKVIESVPGSPRKNLQLVRHVLQDYDTGGAADAARKTIFWKALMRDPRFFSSMNMLIPMGEYPKDEKEREAQTVYQVILRPFLSALPLFLGEWHCSISPLVTRIDSLAARQVSRFQRCEHKAQVLTAPSVHGENLGYMLTCDPNTSPICGTLLTCLLPLNADRPDDFFLRNGMQADLEVIRDTFLFVSREALVEGSCDFRFLETFWRPILKRFLFSEVVTRQKETRDVENVQSAGDLFYKMLVLLKKLEAKEPGSS